MNDTTVIVSYQYIINQLNDAVSMLHDTKRTEADDQYNLIEVFIHIEDILATLYREPCTVWIQNIGTVDISSNLIDLLSLINRNMENESAHYKIHDEIINTIGQMNTCRMTYVQSNWPEALNEDDCNRVEPKEKSVELKSPLSQGKNTTFVSLFDMLNNKVCPKCYRDIQNAGGYGKECLKCGFHFDPKTGKEL